MKKVFIFLGLIIFAMTSCVESKVKNTAINYVKKSLKNPDSFNVISVETQLDTIPFYLRKDILSTAKEYAEALDKWDRYKDMSYLWATEKKKYLSNALTLHNKLQSLCKDEQTYLSSKEYIVYIEYSGTNSIGGILTNREIVIIKKDNPNKVIGSFLIDKDFIGQFFCIKSAIDSDFNLPRNLYGKFELENLPYIERFILSEEN